MGLRYAIRVNEHPRLQHRYLCNEIHVTIVNDRRDFDLAYVVQSIERTCGKFNAVSVFYGIVKNVFPFYFIRNVTIIIEFLYFF